MEITDIKATDLQDEILGPIMIKEYREQVTKRLKDDKSMLILAMYIDSILQNFKIFLRTEIHLTEDDIRLVLDDNNSSFNTYESKHGNYFSKDLSDALFNIFQPE